MPFYRADSLYLPYKYLNRLNLKLFLTDCDWHKLEKTLSARRVGQAWQSVEIGTSNSGSFENGITVS